MHIKSRYHLHSHVASAVNANCALQSLNNLAMDLGLMIGSSLQVHQHLANIIHRVGGDMNHILKSTVTIPL